MDTLKENSANERLEEKSSEEIDKPSEDENSSEKKSVFAEDDNPPEDENSVEYQEYWERKSKETHDLFFS